MRKKLFKNWTLKIASLLLAFIVWFIVVQIDDPSETKPFYNVPVTLKNAELLEKENKVYEVLEASNSIRVTIRAPRSVIRQLTVADIVAEADMSRLTEVNTIPITLSVPNAEINSVVGSPDVLKLSVEEKVSKWIRVQHSTVGKVQDGYMVSNITADQTLIEVTGPKSAVEKVSYAGITIDVSGATTNLYASVETQLYDADGKPLNLYNVVKNVNYVRMSVEVMAVKSVPIELNVMGIPAEGYLATGEVICEPTEIMIAGLPSILSNVTKITIPKEELNITGQTGNMVNVISAKDYLPENIKLADSTFNGRVTATVFIEPESVKTIEITEANLTMKNVPLGYQADLVTTEETYYLKFAGLAENVEQITKQSVHATIDFAEWMKKEKIDKIGARIYSVPVEFDLGEEIEVRNDVNIKIVFTELED